MGEVTYWGEAPDDAVRCCSSARDEGFQCALVDGHELPHIAPFYGSWNDEHTFHSWGDDWEAARAEYDVCQLTVINP